MRGNLGKLAGALVVVIGLAAACSQAPSESKKVEESTFKPYEPVDYSQLQGMEGFSDALLQNHFKLYQGYVRNTNILLDKLSSLAKSQAPGTPEYAELKRRLGFEFNGMKLHEYYFSNMGGSGYIDSRSPLYAAIVRSFGSFENWKNDFISTASMRGIGWAVLYLDPQNDRLINFWINEHEVNHPSGGNPILVLDVWEHAYMPDYQLDRNKYIEAFFKVINWGIAGMRYDAASLPAVKGQLSPESTPREVLRSWSQEGSPEAPKKP